MQVREDKLADYLVKYIGHELNSEEMSELRQWLREKPEDRRLFINCLSAYRRERRIGLLRELDPEESWRYLSGRIEKNRHLRLHRIISYAALFLVLMGISLGAYLFLQQRPDTIIQSEKSSEKGKVVLTLSGGRQVILGEGQQTIGEKEVMIKDSLSHLSYQKVTADEYVPEYNEIFVPRGASYSLTLADGTKVWLNSDSHMHFPVVFSSVNREIELDGEAYFEVTHDEHRPFIVKVQENRVEVLGTHFNVAAYEDGKMYTTLAEGCVKVSSEKAGKLLLPGEQAEIIEGRSEIEVKKVDVGLYTSWRLGIYEFRNLSLEEIAEYLMRWYDTDIRFTSAKFKMRRFTGVIKRADSLELSIQNLQKISGLHFENIDGIWWVNE